MKKKPRRQDPDILALKRVLSTQAEDGTISEILYEMAERAVRNLELRLKPMKPRPRPAKRRGRKP